MYANPQLIGQLADQHRVDALRRAAHARAVREAVVRAERPERPPPPARLRRRISVL